MKNLCVKCLTLIFVVVCFFTFLVGCGDDVTKIVQNPEVNIEEKSVEFDVYIPPVIKYGYQKITYLRFEINNIINIRNFYEAELWYESDDGSFCYVDSSDIDKEGYIFISLSNLENCTNDVFFYEGGMNFKLIFNSYVDISWEVNKSDLNIYNIGYEYDNMSDDNINLYYHYYENVIKFEEGYYSIENPYSTYNDNDFSLQKLMIKIPNPNSEIYIELTNHYSFSNDYDEDDLLGDLLGDLLDDENESIYNNDFQGNYLSDQNGYITIYPNLSIPYTFKMRIKDSEGAYIEGVEIIDSNIYEKNMDVFFVNPW